MRQRSLISSAAAAAILLCFAVYWKAFFTWFHMDDFAWLGLPLEVHSTADLLRVLFVPEAQGTVRVFSERLYFLALAAVFGLNAIPFKIVGFVTAFVNLVLIVRVTRRLTASDVAAFLAPLLYVLSMGLVLPMSWIAAYNELLFTTVVLGAFYSLLRYIETGQRRYWTAQWVVFLLGFGVLETTVVYPALATIYALCCARAHVRRTLPLWIPSIAFVVLHFTLIPNSGGPAYRMVFDAGMFRTLYTYLSWTIGPRRFPLPHHWGSRVTVAIAIALAVFLWKRLRKRDYRPVFLLAWFVITIAPLLPIQNQRYEHYLAVPAVGLCMLGAWAAAEAWSTRQWPYRTVAVVLVGAYAVGNWIFIDRIVTWRYQISRSMEQVVRAARDSNRRTHRDTLLLMPVDEDLYAAGIPDEPFRLIGIKHTYMVAAGPAHAALGAGQPYTWITREEGARMAASGDAIALSLEGGGVREIVAAVGAATRIVNVGRSEAASRLGPTWHGIENGYRWMPESASVRLPAPVTAGERLYVHGFCPGILLGKGPVRLAVSAGGRTLGTVAIAEADAQFSFDFALPETLVGGGDVTVELRVDHTLSAPPDPRQLGMVFGTFEVR